MPWLIAWQLRSTDVLEGLTATHEGTAELGSHFSPKTVMAYAEEQARAEAHVVPGDVRALEIRIERTGEAA